MNIHLRCFAGTQSSYTAPHLGEVALLLPEVDRVEVRLDGSGECVEFLPLVRTLEGFARGGHPFVLRAPETIVQDYRDLPVRPEALWIRLVEVPEIIEAAQSDEDCEGEAD